MIPSLFILITFLLSLVSMPIIIKICTKKGIYDYHDARKIHSGNIPRLGGVGIFIAYNLVALIFLITSYSDNLKNIIPIFIAGFIIFAFAFLDDLLTLPALAKLIVQLIAVSIVTISGFRFKQIFSWILPTPVSFVLTFGWILGVINAYNLIDGLDGLCGSFSITAITTLGILYFLSGNPEYILCFMLAASILGFLCYNWPPAKLFMGDAGSQFLGFMISVFPLFSSGNTFEYNKFIIMIVITAFPVFDTIAAIWRRLRDKRPIMSPDRSHLHHKLLNMGYSRTSALYLMCFLQLLLCSSVLIAYFLGAKKGMALLIESAVFVSLFFSFVHYTNRAINLRNNLAEQGSSKSAPAENSSTATTASEGSSKK